MHNVNQVGILPKFKALIKLFIPPIMVKLFMLIMPKSSKPAEPPENTDLLQPSYVDWQLTTLGGGRAIELPWMLCHTMDGADKRCLDVGGTDVVGGWSRSSTGRYLLDSYKSVFAIDRRVPKALGIVDYFCVADGVELPFRNESFDLVTCVSVLEHAGLAEYGQRPEEEADCKVFAEMLRVLRVGGRLLLTVPCGVDEIHAGWIRGYSRHRLDRLLQYVSGLGYPAVEVEASYYRNSKIGWLYAGEEQIREVRQFQDPKGDINGLYCGVFVRYEQLAQSSGA